MWAVWVAWGPVRETLSIAGNESTSASYYAPVERYLAAHVRDQLLAIDKINVGLDAAKSVLERIEQWTFVLVIIMRMDAG